MKRARKAIAGFTIIEVMLFLAVAGLMMIGIIAAANNGINNQRYSSAVTGLQSYLQDQYNQTANVRNDRPDSQWCTTSGVISSATPTTVGASPCSVLGRFITTDTAAKVLTSVPVYATRDVITTLNNAVCSVSDQQMFAATCLNPFADTTQPSKYTLEWDTSIQTTGGSKLSTLAVLIYRSPLSGQIGAIWNTTGTQTLANLLANSKTSKLTTCINQSGWTTIPIMGVQIDTSTIGTSNAIARVGDSVC